MVIIIIIITFMVTVNIITIITISISIVNINCIIIMPAIIPINNILREAALGYCTPKLLGNPCLGWTRGEHPRAGSLCRMASKIPRISGSDISHSLPLRGPIIARKETSALGSAFPQGTEGATLLPPAVGELQCSPEVA